MAKEIRSWKRWPLRHRVAAAILTALPLLAVAGALIPNVVAVNALHASDPETSRMAAETLRAGDEILVPRSFWTDVVPELNELASLFVDVAALSETIAKVRSITGFVATERDLILLPDDMLHTNAFHATVVSATPPVGAPGDMMYSLGDICSLNGSTHGSCLWDEFGEQMEKMRVDAGGNVYAGAGSGVTAGPSTTVPVPEPSTATMMALGLVALAATRRRDSRIPLAARR